MPLLPRPLRPTPLPLRPTPLPLRLPTLLLRPLLRLTPLPLRLPKKPRSNNFSRFAASKTAGFCRQFSFTRFEHPLT